jgi:hypothetical protein
MKLIDIFVLKINKQKKHFRADQDFVFEVVVPSIPGYGFSSAPRKMGFHFGHCARIFNDLVKS